MEMMALRKPLKAANANEIRIAPPQSGCKRAFNGDLNELTNLAI